jgi:hypothetical protein
MRYALAGGMPSAARHDADVEKRPPVGVSARCPSNQEALRPVPVDLCVTPPGEELLSCLTVVLNVECAVKRRDNTVGSFGEGRGGEAIASRSDRRSAHVAVFGPVVAGHVPGCVGRGAFAGMVAVGSPTAARRPLATSVSVVSATERRCFSRASAVDRTCTTTSRQPSQFAHIYIGRSTRRARSPASDRS